MISNVGSSGWRGTASVAIEYPPATPSGITSPASSNSGLYWVTWNGVSGALRYELQRKSSTSTTWVEIQDSSATSKYMSDPTQGLFYYRVRACKVFACSGWSSATSTQVTSGEDCEENPWMMQTTEDETTGSSTGDAVIMGPPCPIEP